MADDPIRRRSVATPDGGRLAILETGDPAGPAVLFLHGFGFGAAVWRKQLAAPALAGFRLVAVDLRGHGSSSLEPDDRFDGPMWSADVSAILDALELTDVTIVAWSYAGLVLGDQLAAHGPDRVAAAILVAAASRAGRPEYLVDFGAGSIPDGLLDDDPTVHRPADRRFVLECEGEAPFDEADRAELTAIVEPTPRETLRRLLRRTVEHDPMWAGLRIPTLLVHGTADRINLIGISERMAGIVRPSRLSVYPGVGHLPFWEDQDRFDRELAELVVTRRV